MADSQLTSWMEIYLCSSQSPPHNLALP